MSWSKEGFYKDVEAAQVAIEADYMLPVAIKTYILAGLTYLAPSAPVYIKGHGHLCDGPGSYAVTSAELTVKSMPFAEK